MNRVEVRISRNTSDEIFEGLRGEGRPREEGLRVGTLMKTKIEGTAFDITPIGSDTQELPDTGFREWRWNITPTSSGTQQLFLTVSVLYDSQLIDEKVFEREISVGVDPVYSTSRWMAENWVTVITVIGVAVGIVESFRRLRRKQGSAGETS